MTPQPTNSDEPRRQESQATNMTNYVNCAFCELPIKRPLRYCSPCAVRINKMTDEEFLELTRVRNVPQAKIDAFIEEKGLATPPPQPANPLPSGEISFKEADPEVSKLVTENIDELFDEPTTPIETDPVNTWMLAGGWTWDNEAEMWRQIINLRVQSVPQDLATEMYRQYLQGKVEEVKNWRVFFGANKQLAKEADSRIAQLDAELKELEEK